jgi:hypothetical protein
MNAVPKGKKIIIRILAAKITRLIRNFAFSQRHKVTKAQSNKGTK